MTKQFIITSAEGGDWGEVYDDYLIGYLLSDLAYVRETHPTHNFVVMVREVTSWEPLANEDFVLRA